MEALLLTRFATVSREIRFGIVVLVGALILMLPIVLNGGAIYYYDTAAYVEQVAKGVNSLFGVDATGSPASLPPAAPEALTAQEGLLADHAGGFGMAEGDNVLLTGRSPFYGAAAFAGWQTSMWLVVAVQSATLSWLVVSLMRLVAEPVWFLGSILTLAGLALLTPAAFFAGLIMPDIWTGAMILALALLWASPRTMSKISLGVVFCILVFAVLAHKTNLALLIALVACRAVFVVVKRLRAPQRQLGDTAEQWTFALPALALVCGLAGNALFSVALREVYDVSPIARPHITAHLVDLGPGTRFARDTCPESGFEICDYVDRLPIDWIEFLFETDRDTGVFGAATPAGKTALSQEQVAFAFATLGHLPMETLAGLAKQGLSQLWTISVDGVPLSHERSGFLNRNFPPDLIPSIEQTALYQHPRLSRAISRIGYVSSGIAAVFLTVWAGLRLRHRGLGTADPHHLPQALRTVILVCLGGLVANALICGVLASPYGRFQARVIWILPFLACLVLAWEFARAAGRRQSTEAS